MMSIQPYTRLIRIRRYSTIIPIKMFNARGVYYDLLKFYYITKYYKNIFLNFQFGIYLTFFLYLNTTDCGTLTSPENGNVTYSSGTTYLSSASFTCNSGYTKSSTVTRTCMADKTWSNVTPHCIINGKVPYFK